MCSGLLLECGCPCLVDGCSTYILRCLCIMFVYRRCHMSDRVESNGTCSCLVDNELAVKEIKSAVACSKVVFRDLTVSSEDREMLTGENRREKHVLVPL